MCFARRLNLVAHHRGAVRIGGAMPLLGEPWPMSVLQR